MHSILGWNAFNHKFFSRICAFAPKFCRSMMRLIGDKKVKYENASRMDVIIGHEAGGTSLSLLYHWR